MMSLGESMFEMQEQELTLMLEEAEASVEHLKNVINKYEGQADRWTQMALASIKVQKELFSTLTTNKETMITRFEEFKEAAEVWEAKQIVKGNSIKHLISMLPAIYATRCGFFNATGCNLQNNVTE